MGQTFSLTFFRIVIVPYLSIGCKKFLFHYSINVPSILKIKWLCILHFFGQRFIHMIVYNTFRLYRNYYFLTQYHYLQFEKKINTYYLWTVGLSVETFSRLAWIKGQPRKVYWTQESYKESFTSTRYLFLLNIFQLRYA